MNCRLIRLLLGISNRPFRRRCRLQWELISLVVVIYVKIAVEAAVDSTVVELQDTVRHLLLHRTQELDSRLSPVWAGLPLAVLGVHFGGSHRGSGVVVAAVGRIESVVGSVDIEAHLLTKQLRGLGCRFRRGEVTFPVLDFVGGGVVVDIAGSIGIVDVVCCCVTDEHGIAVHRLSGLPRYLSRLRL